MPEIMEIVVPFGVGAGDGLSDAGLKYVDEVMEREDAPLLKRPSTIAHIVASGAAGVASYMFLGGNARLMGFQVAGRHLGKVGGEAAWTFAHEEPFLGAEFELEEEEGFELEETGGFELERESVESEPVESGAGQSAQAKAKPAGMSF